MPDKESEFVEFKTNWRDEYLKAVSSFANDKGGMLMIGMDDQGNPVGLKNAKRLLENLPNKIRNKLGIIPSLEIEKKNQVDIIKVIIQPSSTPISHDGRFYIRSGSTIQELRGTALSDFLMRKSGVTWDEVCEERAAFEDLNKETIKKFKNYSMDRIPSITEEENLQILLHKLKLVDHNRLKRAAVLLFGNNPQRRYLQSVVKIGKFISDTDIQFTDIINGNLFQQLENTIEILRSKYLVSNIKFEGMHRRDILEYPYEALREAVINALIHRDYSGTSHIQIRVYPDKLTIMNEGKLPPEVPVEKLKTDHLSKPRNRLLAEIFYYAGFIEAWGRGTLKIFNHCLQQGLPEPSFSEENGVMCVTFFKEKWTEENLKKLELNDRQVKAVMYVRQNGKITNQEYRELTTISKPMATIDLNDLVKKRVFKKTGTTGRGTRYLLLI